MSETTIPDLDALTAEPGDTSGEVPLESMLDEFNSALSNTEPVGHESPDGMTIEPTSNTVALSHVIEWAQHVDAERAAQIEAEDAANVMAWAKQETESFTIPEDYAENFVRSRYLTDAELSQTWDGRYESDEAMANCERALRRTMKALKQSAGQAPDPGATADREAVTAAVMGASNQAPESPAPDLSHVSDKALREYTRKNFKFEPNI